MHQLPPYKPEGFGLESTLETISFCDVAEVWDDLVDGLKHPSQPLDQHPSSLLTLEQGKRAHTCAGHSGRRSQETPPSFFPEGLGRG